jgi:hypothetical protein
MQSGIMMNRDLDYAPAVHFQTADEFDADGAASRSQVRSYKCGSPDEPEIAVYVPDANAKQKPGELVVQPANRNAVRWIMPLDFENIDERHWWVARGK